VGTNDVSAFGDTAKQARHVLDSNYDSSASSLPADAMLSSHPPENLCLLVVTARARGAIPEEGE